MYLDIAQLNLDMACETGNHVLFMRAMYEVFRTIPVENIFPICLAQAEICLQIEKLEESKKIISEFLALLRNTSPYFHIDESAYKSLDLSLPNISHFDYFYRAVNHLWEAATKSDTHWQRSLLIKAYHRMTIYRIVAYQLAVFPDNPPKSEIWNEAKVIEFRKTIFRDFKRTLSTDYGLF